MRVGLIYAGDPQVQLSCKADEGATVESVITQSGILQMCHDIDLDSQRVGVYGRFVKLDSVINDGDRIEIYRKVVRQSDDDDDDDED